MLTPTQQHPAHKTNSPFKVLLVICISLLMFTSGCKAFGLAVAGAETAAGIASRASRASNSSSSSDESNSASASNESNSASASNESNSASASNESNSVSASIESSSASNNTESNASASTASLNNRNNTKPEKVPKTCEDFFLGRNYENPCEKISEGMFSYDKHNINPPKDSDLSVEDKLLYRENAKVQGLKEIYAEVKEYCDTKFASYAELCKAFGLNIVLEKRDRIYGFVKTDFTTSDDTRLVMNNTYIIPANDDVYATAEFQRYYNEISDEAKAAAKLNRTITTAAQVKAVKQERFEEEAWGDKPDGTHNKKYASMVTKFVESNIPGIKVKEVLVGNRWWVWHDYDGDPISKHLNAVAIVTIDSMPGYKYIMGCTFRIDREHEGGGRYGDPYLAKVVYSSLRNVEKSLDQTHEYNWYTLDNDHYRMYHDLEYYIPIVP